MSHRRVGTFSMGILLIALGIIMLVSQFMEVSILRYILKWWPITLVILGTEVLVYVFLSNQEDPKVKFDVFSIFITIVIILVSIGIYALTNILGGLREFTIPPGWDFKIHI